MPKALAYFVHIPKTAGNSLRQRLRSYGVLANPAYTKKEREQESVDENVKGGNNKDKNEIQRVPIHKNYFVDFKIS